MLPQYGGFRGVLFSAFLFLSCASCQSESGLAANVYSAFTIIGWGKPELSLGAFSWKTRLVVVATIWRLLVVHVGHLVRYQIDLENQAHCYLICFLNSKTGLQEHRHQIVPWNEKAWLCCDVEYGQNIEFLSVIVKIIEVSSGLANQSCVRRFLTLTWQQLQSWPSWICWLWK